MKLVATCLSVMILAGMVWGDVTPRPTETQPATQPGEKIETRTRVVHPFETLANSMPKKFWPSKNETAAIRKLRDDWVRENFVGSDQGAYVAGKMPVWKWTGTVEDVSDGGRKGQAKVRIKIDDMQIWGNWVKVQVDATIADAPASTLEWPKGKTVTVSGIYLGADWSHAAGVASEFPMTIRTISELTPAAKPQTKSNGRDATKSRK